jgi:transcriptional regulator with XRE-family HTH domain
MARSGEGRRIRQLADATQAEVAESAGVTAATIHLWETGQRVPTGARAERYFDAIECLRRELLERR